MAQRETNVIRTMYILSVCYEKLLIFICRSVVDVRWPVGKQRMRWAKMVLAKSDDLDS